MKLPSTTTGLPSVGFTLIELLVTLSILLVLVSTAAYNYQLAQVRARVARVHADHSTIATALELYRADNRTYPVAADGDFLLDLPLASLTTPAAYVSVLPTDPFGPASYDIAPAVVKLGYIYLDAASTSRGIPAETYGHIWQQERQLQYIVQSCGPNRRWDVIPYRDYDATNGTVSSGDICTLGRAR
jgi:prepilin-type N-terminal cleavage/methylation domain-containing protein